MRRVSLLKRTPRKPLVAHFFCSLPPVRPGHAKALARLAGPEGAWEIRVHLLLVMDRLGDGQAGSSGPSMENGHCSAASPDMGPTFSSAVAFCSC